MTAPAPDLVTLDTRGTGQPVAMGEPSPDDTNLVLGRIGPNAIIQAFESLQISCGSGERDRIARAAGLAKLVTNPPTAMMDERAVVALHRSIRQMLPPARAEAVLYDAGLRTARYILANRIPGPARTLLRLLPARLASRLLLAAVAKHAWTFIGSGTFVYAAGNPVRVTLKDCPACYDVYPRSHPARYYEGAFAGLFGALVHRASWAATLTAGPTVSRDVTLAIAWPPEEPPDGTQLPREHHEHANDRHHPNRTQRADDDTSHRG